jgi:hypothetical protein
MNFGAVTEEQFTFYSMAAISFLESAVPAYVENLCLLYQKDADFQEWLRTTWQPEERRHGQWAREYLHARWPDFNWDKAFAMYYANEPKASTDHLHPSPALEAMSRCVTESQTAMVYIALSRYTSDPSLKALLRRMSADEVRHYKIFLHAYRRHVSSEKVNLIGKIHALLRRSNLVVTKDIYPAFSGIENGWASSPPWMPLTYSRFLSAAGEMMKRYFPVRTATHLLFQPFDLRDPLSGILEPFLRYFMMRMYPNFL